MAQTRTRTLFTVDIVVAAAFLVGAVSSIAFLVPYSTIDFATSSSAPAFLGVSYGIWRSMHVYAGIAMIAGGLVHFSMHWRWMVRAARDMVPGSSARRRGAVQLDPARAAADQAGGPTDG